MPDVIGTQEALFEQVKDIDEDLPEYDWIGLGREGGSRSEFMAVFYQKERLEPMAFDHFWLSDTPDVIGSTTWGNTNRRMVTWVRFRDRYTGNEFYLFNTHFDHQVLQANVNSANLVVERILKLKSELPILLVGDFNATAENSETYDIFINRGKFIDTWNAAAQRKGEGLSTYNGFKTGSHLGSKRIDWILTKGSVNVKSAEIVDFQRNGQYPSDHFPVVTWLSFGK